MSRRIGLAASLSALCLMTGCWDRAELPEKGFVMGIAIDEGREGKISLATQIYRPSQGVSSIGAKTAETAFVNITTEDKTVARAIRDIPINLGRKAQWSHIRLIMIGDKLARKRPITELLEFFYRDHEPRLTIKFMITNGEAYPFLQLKPYIENTISQQLFQSEKAAAENSTKTIDMDLLKLGLQLKGETGNAVVPYLYETQEPLKRPEKTPNVAGLALLKKGKLVGVMDPSMVEYLQMLTGVYKNGMLDIPCRPSPEGRQVKEVVEALNSQSRLQTSIGPESATVRFQIKIDLALIELACTKIKTSSDERKFAKQVEDTVRERIEETVDWMKEQKFDGIGLGNKINAKNPKLWKKWKPDWDSRFARTRFKIDVKVKLKTSGTTIGKPVFKK
ncbi:Ger(x)C family spore germination protein [Cohnella sp. CFH 77786]|uniref:Ger(x)C family spore germination protein n=1 Tax=Cohnella sp. CFH 77786 TaxID=2662265 RepID=UPI001C60FDFF|nr:Ger(x)C family spore germination protein [Cohnella sp. CFH 77786]MBW5445325.1 Ger(x)C family spore germination protein [Cohnella sp. CFH 77786]